LHAGPALHVKDYVPQCLSGAVERRMTDAYHASSAPEAEAALLALAKELDRTHPAAAASLREGLAETLTVLRLNVAVVPPNVGVRIARVVSSRMADLGSGEASY
jgi:hypothetical protein